MKCNTFALLIALAILMQSTANAQPTITSFSPSSGSIGTLVTITGNNLNNPTSITIGGISAIVISNTGTNLVAMLMPGAVTGIVSVTTASGTTNCSSSFTVTASQPPNTQQGNKLVGTGNTGAARQGYSVSLSADGNTAIVGGDYDNNFQGAAWIYTRSGGVWTQQGNKLVGTGTIGTSYQGKAVSLSADGNTAIVGGDGDSVLRGAAWIFIRNGGVWTQQGNKLVGTGSIGTSSQGCSISLSADGNTAIVGGFRDNNYQGAAWIFTRSGGVWTQQGNKLIGTGSIGNPNQGCSVSLSADGNTAIVGGAEDNNGNGAAWVYTRSGGGVWTQQGNKLVGTGNTAAARQGASVSLSADGNTALLGGPLDNGNGAAWVFTRSGSGVWTQQGNKLVGTGSMGNPLQGYSVSLSADGNTAIVGGSEDNNYQGAAWVYTRSGSGVWTQQGNKLVGTGGTSGARQGSVSLSADGNTAMIGGLLDNNSQGAVWIFANVALPITLSQFSATKQNNIALLQWNSKAEINALEYQIERSIDGLNFEKLGLVLAKGVANNYVFNDDKLPANTSKVYYRLKLVDKDGKYSYSVIRTLNPKETGTGIITVYPNPVKGRSFELQLQGIDKGHYLLKLFNSKGQLVHTESFEVQNSNSSLSIQTKQHLVFGMYHLQIVNVQNASKIYQQNMLVE